MTTTTSPACPVPWCWLPDRAGCDPHLSEPATIRATAESATGDQPLVAVHAWQGSDGRAGVLVQTDRPDREESWATLTAQEWRALVAAGNAALALIEAA